MGFLTAAGMFNLMGLAAYTGLTFQFGHWLQEYMVTSARSTYSFVYVLSILVHLFTWAPVLIAWTCGRMGEAEDIAEDMAWEKKQLLYGFDDEYGPVGYDQHGNPIDEYGNPAGMRYDEYGHPMPQTDEYGNPTHGSYHVSAYSEHEMHQPVADPRYSGGTPGYGGTTGYGSYADPYGAQAPSPAPSPYGSYHDPYAQPVQGSFGQPGQDPYAQPGQDPYAQPGQPAGSYTYGQPDQPQYGYAQQSPHQPQSW